MKDDNLRSSGNQSTYGSPIKKFLYKSDRSIKVRPIKNLVNIFWDIDHILIFIYH